MAYNAARQLATLALAAEGFRTDRLRAHERTIQSLRYTVGSGVWVPISSRLVASELYVPDEHLERCCMPQSGPLNARHLRVPRSIISGQHYRGPWLGLEFKAKLSSVKADELPRNVEGARSIENA